MSIQTIKVHVEGDYSPDEKRQIIESVEQFLEFLQGFKGFENILNLLDVKEGELFALENFTESISNVFSESNGGGEKEKREYQNRVWLLLGAFLMKRQTERARIDALSAQYSKTQ